MNRVFEKARKGAYIADIYDFVYSQGGEPARVLRVLRAGTFGGKRWEVKEEFGKIKVTYPVED